MIMASETDFTLYVNSFFAHNYLSQTLFVTDTTMKWRCVANMRIAHQCTSQED